MGKRAVIVGAGIGGLTAAQALRQRDWDVEIFEAAAAFSEIGAGIQLSPNATRVLHNLGLLDPIRTLAFEPQAATIRDGVTGRTLLYVPLASLCTRLYGTPYLHIHRPSLHAGLREGLEQQIHLNSPVLGYEGHRLSIEGSAAGTADLIVAADGVKSTMNRQMNGPESPRFTGQVAWRGLVPVTPALRKLFAPHATVWAGQGRHFVTYYLGPDLLNFVGVTEQNDWQEEGWNLPGDRNEFRDHFASFHTAIQALIEATESVQRWALFDRKPLDRWASGPVALLGDAAHPTLPFVAQGAALAMEDAWALAQYAPDLQAYERARQPRAARLQSLARANAKLYHSHRVIDRLKLRLSRGLLRGPQAHLLFWSIFNYGAWKAPGADAQLGQSWYRKRKSALG